MGGNVANGSHNPCDEEALQHGEPPAAANARGAGG